MRAPDSPYPGPSALQDPSRRGLTDAERQLALSVFGDAIDYEAVRIHKRKWIFFQPRNVTMAPRGHLHFHPRSEAYCPCFAQENMSFQGHFIHEMVHVWQHQKGLNLLWRRHPFCSYSYSIKPGWRLERYGIEQQAEIVRHVFLLRNGHVVPGAPPLASLESILPFRPIRTQHA